MCRTANPTPQGCREDVLCGRFNEFFNHILSTRELNYYAMLSTADFIELKKVLSTVNNIITLRVTDLFICKLERAGLVTSGQLAEIRHKIDSTSANANGYDIEYTGSGGKGILAEIKCNIPVKEDAFGAAQAAGIRKDIDRLFSGKPKSAIEDTSEYYKFMVLFDCGGGLSKAMDRIISAYEGAVQTISLEGGADTLSTDKVYVVYLPL